MHRAAPLVVDVESEVPIFDFAIKQGTNTERAGLLASGRAGVA